MHTVTLSSRFQVTIPEDIRESMKLRPGSRLTVLERQGIIELIPVGPMNCLRGFLKGIDTTVDRDEDRV